LPVLDNEKHYFISKHEVEKLLAKGGDWLPTHPYKEAIVRRYLRNVGNLTKLAMAQLTDTSLVEDDEESLSNEPVALKKRKNDLHFQRLESAAAVLVQSGAQSVVDLGCGEGKLMQILMKIGQFRKITGMDVSMTELRKAKDRLHWDELSPRELERLTLMQGSLTFRDKRLVDFDAAALIEVIEHLDLERLAALERTVFEFAKPKMVIVTTPNSEYNVKYDTLSAGDFRHDDHRFEWTRAEFAAWATKISQQFGYTFEILGVGTLDEKVGTPSQMAVFKKQV
jgi:3' terminal RNA ribose 2'-O-methyltransferase Hen1